MWEERIGVLEQLSFLIEKMIKNTKKPPFGQTALSPVQDDKVQNEIQYSNSEIPILFCLVLRTLREVTALREGGMD